MNKNKLALINKITLCSLIIMLIIGISSCKKDENLAYIDDAIAIVYANNTPYLINAKLETYNLAKYDWVDDNFDDYIIVKKDDLFGFINRSGKEIIAPQYTNVYPMREGKALVTLNDKQFIIDTNGNKLYEFSDGVISNSYFSNNRLLVQKDNLYGYLIYDNNNFTLGDIKYSYASTYKDNYAVVGDYEKEIIYKVIEVYDVEGEVHTEVTDEIDYIITKENLKFNYIDLDEHLLFDEYQFDFADAFYDGWARVGNIGDIYAQPAGKRDTSKSTTGMIYSYINSDGEYLHLDYEYVYSHIVYTYNQWGQATESTLVNDEIHDTSLVAYPFATNFNDGYCVTAKYVYTSTTNMFVKEFMIIGTDGNMEYVEAIYFAPTSFKYGYDSSTDYRSQTAGKFGISKIIKIDNVIAFRVSNTLSNPFYSIKYSTFDYERGYNMFADVTWDTFKTITDEDGKQKTVSAEWMNDYIKTYLPTAKTNLLAKNAAENPYEMNDFKYSRFYSSTSPITGARIIRSNTYGIIALRAEISHDDVHDKDVTIIHADYIIPPIYEKVIY